MAIKCDFRMIQAHTCLIARPSQSDGIYFNNFFFTDHIIFNLQLFLYGADGEIIDIKIGNCGKMCPVGEFEQIMSSFLLKDYKGECKQDLLMK